MGQRRSNRSGFTAWLTHVFTAADCETAAQMFLDAAQFQGTYRSQETALSKAPGRFTVLVFDQGEPGRTKDPAFVTGDGFSIDLKGGPYALYTRAGYIEGGNIQVDNTRHIWAHPAAWRGYEYAYAAGHSRARLWHCALACAESIQEKPQPSHCRATTGALRGSVLRS